MEKEYLFRGHEKREDKRLTEVMLGARIFPLLDLPRAQQATRTLTSLVLRSILFGDGNF